MWILGLVIVGFVVGALARWALPGPDPMPWYATIGLGVGGIVVGLVIGSLIQHALGILGAFIGAVILLYLYRRFAQGRGLTGAPR